MKNKLINLIENTQLKKNLPPLKVGLITELELWLHEGPKKRLQKFEGLIIAIKNKGLNTSVLIRKISYGETIERVFKIHSPLINKIIIKGQYYIHKAKLYYFRYLSSKHIKKIKYIKIK